MKKIAIIGSGATAIYLLKHLMDNRATLSEHITEIAIFEKGEILGMGMPYNPNTTDLHNLSNIASEELPELIETFADWLKNQDKKKLKELGLADEKISKSEVYNRLSLGQYLQSQYYAIIDKVEADGISVKQYANCEIKDVKYHNNKKEVELVSASESYVFNKVVISTGHVFNDEDDSKRGNYASPWPIFKILPEEGKYHNFKIGTLGASLSAFDVVSSLSRRHGEFITDNDGKMTFYPAKGAENFSIAMHAANGWLPHLQYEQQEPMREIYRHVQRDELLDMIEANGFLRLETYFDKVCRPALKTAFEKDAMPDMVTRLEDEGFGLTDFVEIMTKKHEFGDAFEGMKLEMSQAKDSVNNKNPIHWKEVTDDLMYALNFHAELMPAEDHILFHKEVMPFLMNVIAAMPLPSGNLLLALYNAGKIEIVPGFVEIPKKQKHADKITVHVTNGDEESTIDYEMFINCSGQKAVGLNEYPFQDLVKKGTIRQARAVFVDKKAAKDLSEDKQERVFVERNKTNFYTGGMDIDASYRAIGEDGEPNDCIHDITFTHTGGVRPYSYGLQACSATSQILVEAWVKSLEQNQEIMGDIKKMTELYEETAEL